MSEDRLPFDELFLREKLNHNPSDWDTRLQFADGLYEKEAYAEAAEVIWNGRIIPSNDLDLALSIRILSKAQPRKAIRLLTAVLELNQGKAAHNMAMANAMLHYGMALQAIRFYGAALEIDPTLVNPDIESFILWSDDKNALRGMLEKRISNLGNLPRMLRNPREAFTLESRLCLHEMPVYLPDLSVAAGEEFNNEAFLQNAVPDNIAPPTPISKSSVPTAVLHVKWSTAPAPTSDTAAPVAAPVAAPPVAPASPFTAAEPPAPGPRKLHIPGAQ